jgi:hypothetical protein
MSEVTAPPPRPSTERTTAAPMAALRDQPRPKVVTVSFWCWMIASLVVGAAIALLSTKIEPMRAEFARLARTSDPAATQATVDRVAGASVLLVLGTGAILGLLALTLAGALRAGRNWARILLTLIALIAMAYGAFLATAANDAMLGNLRMVISVVLLAYTAIVATAAICMLLPGTKTWFHRPR